MGPSLSAEGAGTRYAPKRYPRDQGKSQRTPREAGGLLGWAVSKTAIIG